MQTLRPNPHSVGIASIMTNQPERSSDKFGEWAPSFGIRTFFKKCPPLLYNLSGGTHRPLFGDNSEPSIWDNIMRADIIVQYLPNTLPDVPSHK